MRGEVFKCSPRLRQGAFDRQTPRRDCPGVKWTMDQRKQVPPDETPPANVMAVLLLPELPGDSAPVPEAKNGFVILGGGALLAAVPPVAEQPVTLQLTIVVPAAGAAPFRSLIGESTASNRKQVSLEWFVEGDRPVSIAGRTLTDWTLEVHEVLDDRAGAGTLVFVALQLRGVVCGSYENGNGPAGPVSVSNEPSSI